MSDYRIEFGTFVGPNDTERLYQLLSVVSEGDELQITMNQNDPAQVNSIIDALNSKKFEVAVLGGHGENKYLLIAHKRSIE